MVDWTKDALKAGVDASIESQKYPREILSLAEYEEAQTHMRAALDAAVKAQKEVKLEGYAYHAPSYMRGRAEALEEAAKVIEPEKCPEQTEWDMGFNAGLGCAQDAIRSLKDKPKEGGE